MLSRSLRLALGTLALVACAPPPPEPVAPSGREALDPEVIELVQAKLAAARANPGDARVHGTLGLVYEANDMWEEAERSFANAYALDPDPLWLLHRAISWRQAGDDGESLALLREAARRLPDHAGAQHRLGVALFEIGDVDGAEAAFRRAASLAPRYPQPDVGLAQVSLERGENAAALASAEAAVRKAQDYKHAHYVLGLALRAVGRVDEGARELTRGLGGQVIPIAGPLDAEMKSYAVNYSGQIARATDLVDANQPDAAAAIYAKLLARRPDDVNVLSNYGLAELRRGRFQEAEALFERALAVEPDAFATHLNLANCYLGMNRLDDAEAECKRCLELEPETSQAHFLRAKLYARRGDFASAHTSARKSLELDATNPVVYDFLGEICMQLGVEEEARSYYEQAIARAPDNLPAHVNLALVLLHLGVRDRAAEVIAAAEALAPDHPRVVALRQRLDAGR